MRLLRALGWVLVVLLTVVITVRWAGWDRVTPFVQAMVFVPYLAGASLLGTLILFAGGRRKLGVFMVIVTVAYGGALLPRWAVGPVARPKGYTLRVMTVNLNKGSADAKALVRRIAAEKPDILAVQELTSGEAAALSRAGIGKYLPATVLRTASGTAGTGLYAQGGLTSVGLSGTTSKLARARMSVGNASLDLVSVHTRTPMLGHTVSDWTHDLDALPVPKDAGTQVLLGDFNATQDNKAFRDLERDGYTDAAIGVGSGLKPTYSRWPVPPTPVDHVLTEGPVESYRIRAYDLGGTSHRILVADLAVT
ncbi:MAG TPA: endonuclease/exonuclease/phosphatase family protein [Actinocatenispora sp.]